MSHLLAPNSELVSVHTLKPHERNPRQGDIGAILESVEENGFFGGLVVQRSTRKILVGNHRWQAAIEAGLTHLPVFWADIDDAKALKILLADNRTNDQASYDENVLVEILKELDASGYGLQGTGYDGDALDELITDMAKPVTNWDRMYQEKDPVEANALKEQWCTAVGQRWHVPSLSRPGHVHRVVIGDSLKHYPFLLDGVSIDGICTDPPYELEAADVRAIVENYGDVMVAMMADRQAMEFSALWSFRLMLVWHHHKTRLNMNPDLPVINHALCPIFSKLPRAKMPIHFSKPDPKFKTLFDVEVEYEEGKHGHGKSGSVFEYLLSGFAWKHVADPFLGSGATLLACEAQGRTCYGIELDPARAATALDRFERAGLKPELHSDALFTMETAAPTTEKKTFFKRK